MEHGSAFYLLFNTDIMNFAWKTDEGVAENIDLLIFVNRRWIRGGGVGVKQKFLFRAS